MPKGSDELQLQSETIDAIVNDAGNAKVEPKPADWSAMDLNLLVVFDAIMQDRSLTRAARRLGLSQPATSHALARLRIMLRDALFVRAPDGMRPTPRAQQMAEQVREALRLLRQTLEPEGFDPGLSQRRFTLVVNNYAARTVVPGLTRYLADHAPRAMLDVRPIGRLEVLDSLDADGADVALTVLGEGGERFKCVRVMEDDYVAVLDRNHPAAKLPILTAERLASMPHIDLTSTGNDTSFVDRGLAEFGLTRRIAVRVPFLSSTLLLVNSDYVTVLPRRVARDMADICPLVVKDLPFATPWLVLSMIWHRRLDDQPAHRWLREAIRSVGQGGPMPFDAAFHAPLGAPPLPAPLG
jgi:DNA-binding transcriptional LysR family regulator